MRLPRDVSGEELVKRLSRLGYSVTRQSHARLSTQTHGEHHLTIPMHPALRVGTLSAILTDLQAHHHHLDREVLVTLLFE